MRRPTDDLWSKAAIAGGIWAGMEIIAGSYLHNLRIPFAGSILAAAGVMIMTGFYMLWPQKGLIWRTGLICALMKSISPSAIILGPMSGILLEALIMEGTFRLAGKKLIFMVSGGIIAVSSALIHKLISLFFLYGSDIFELYINFYLFLSRKIGLGEMNPWSLAMILIVIYGLAGSLAVISGYRASFYVSKTSKGAFSQAQQKIPFNPLDTEITHKKSGLLLLMVHIICLLGLLFLFHYSFAYWTHIPLVVYILWISFVYKKFIKRIQKSVFVFQMLLIPLFSLFFLGDIRSFPENISIENLIQGLLMDERAILVVGAFTAISTEIRNPAVQALMSSPNSKKLNNALSHAFSALPQIIENSGSIKQLFFHPIRFVAQSLASAVSLYESSKQK